MMDTPSPLNRDDPGMGTGPCVVYALNPVYPTMRHYSTQYTRKRVLQEFRDEVSQPGSILLFHRTDHKAELVASTPTDYGLIDANTLFAVRQHDK
jgi:hypothetical protein